MRLFHFDKVITNEEFGGKIWVFWKTEMDMQLVRMGTQYLSLHIDDGSSHFLRTFIYAKCNRYERQLLWEELSSAGMGVEPCLFAGDFNIIHSDVERCGGSPRTRAAMDDFNRWIHQGRLIEMNSQGRKFSWCNGQHGLSRAWAKLDRVLLDAKLLIAFPYARCPYLSRSTSDHSPMFIEFLKDTFTYGPSPFRFQQMWIEHPDFISFVQMVWSEPAIAIFEEKVEGLEHLLQSNWENEVERELVRYSTELSTWRRREDIRLAQMAKIKWRMEGDRNSKFFHVWLSNKRHRKIHKLRTTDGLEFNSPEEIHLGAEENFSEFLQ
ncbi:uncharacterized protein LOC121253382 [Juglans microcarpa x Juglans regia]|uniref:uncharacterized protein LOC121253382 n=1 Tax=Juglans microcarpa x Juglans regia TaxID=2249226 RepID=UPI001B7E29D9|nr:uncharacterized protein LOC121253382 [Juglans microcarpa x Juglans regia]